MSGRDTLTPLKITREIDVSTSARVRQLEATFDVPRKDRQILTWEFNLPDFRSLTDWNVGLIVGPSGSGKTVLANELFPDELNQRDSWSKKAVVDDFADALDMQTIGSVCMAVGFNTIPAWARPFHVLSNGEQFRVRVARRLAESDDLIVLDEFTSVVDRQVAQIGSHAVQKYCRRNDRRFVGVSCHYDIVEWLQPDWIIDVPQRSVEWRSVQRRPDLEVEIRPVSYATWHVFAPFHYLTTTLHRGARCFGLFVNDRVAAFAGMLHRPHARSRDIMGCSRLVTLPDFQGLGLAFILIDTVSAVYKAVGKRVHCYPAHPPFIRSFDRSKKWELKVRPGTPAKNISGTIRRRQGKRWKQGNRPSAVFEYTGESIERKEAERVLSFFDTPERRGRRAANE